MKPRCFRFPGDGQPWLLLREEDDWGLIAYDLLRPSGRFWADGERAPDPVQLRVDARRVEAVPTPRSLMAELPPGDNWQAMTRRTLAQLRAWFLLAEDPQRRLEARPVCTLAHQASLVAHVVTEEQLRSVLIADEVGLGKTVEAGLILQRLLDEDARLRILYLAPARLVRNVREELGRLGLDFKMWVSGEERDASNQLTDARVVASIHRACHPGHLDNIVEAADWDVVIVDECHHLSDWNKGGGKPTRKYQLVKRLRERLPRDARLILMSGTPHQGHGTRFENLLELLRAPGEGKDAVGGRVIYRTKEDVRDWHGKPLFPRRLVNPPLVLQLDDEHRAWIRGVYGLFQSTGGEVTEARRRAVGWRCGQALQWATSSVQAGIGYLVRQAMRAGWDLDRPSFHAALAALRPYRNGRSDEPVEQLYARIRREIGKQDDDGDVEDIEEGGDEAPRPWKPDDAKLATILEQGLALLAREPDRKWLFLKERVLDHAEGEKVVLFAQPIETVTALASFLERLDGCRPALITGGQSQGERDREIEAFWRPDGPRFLVSSRAGGEGLNLQVARRLVHVDVPWNPMELEQRVGRVHRFLSKKTIIVDTVVVEDSREVDAYRIARDKLHEVSSALSAGDDSRFELLFSRVMSLVPPDELNEVLADSPLGPLSDGDRQRVAALVSEGFDRWRSFHERYSSQRREVAALAPGEASWSDLEALAIDTLGASPAAGVSVLQFEWGEDEEVVESNVGARALEIGGELYTCGDYGGMPVTSGDGRRVRVLGLNTEMVARKLRDLAFPRTPGGAAFIGWPAGQPLPLAGVTLPFGVLVLVRQSVRAHGNQWAAKQADSMRIWVARSDGESFELDGEQRGALVRGLLAGTAKKEPVADTELTSQLARLFETHASALCRPSDEDRDTGTRHGVLPVMAALVT